MSSDGQQTDTGGGMDISLDELVIGGYSKLKSVVLLGLTLSFILIAILFWVGVVTGSGEIPTGRLWQLNIVLTVGVLVAYYAWVVGRAGVSLVAGWVLAIQAIINGDWGWFLGRNDPDNNGPSVIFVTALLVYVLYLVAAPNFGVVALPFHMIYGGALLALGYILIRGGMFVLSGLSSVSSGIARYRREAAADATYEKGVGYYFIVFSLFAAVFLYIAYSLNPNDFSSTTEPGLLTIAAAVAAGISLLTTPFGMFLDTRKTGLYKPYKMRYVYTLISAFPGVGWFVAFYYLLRRHWNEYLTEVESTEEAPVHRGISK